MTLGILHPAEYVAARLAAGDEQGAIIAADEQYAIGIMCAVRGDGYCIAWPENMRQGYADAMTIKLWERVNVRHWSDAYCLQEEPA